MKTKDIKVEVNFDTSEMVNKLEQIRKELQDIHGTLKPKSSKVYVSFKKDNMSNQADTGC
jgi:hypothetical protein